jgi:hypothetical protein
MDNEQAPKSKASSCCAPDEDGLWGMAREFYNRQMLCTFAFVWFWGLVCIAGAVYCGVHFFQTGETRLQIAYAAGFVCFVHGVGMMKIFAWQLIHRNNIKRAIRRLETRVAECIQACQTRP